MSERLAIPYKVGSKTFTEASIRAPKGYVLAETKKAAANVYEALRVFLAGTVKALIDDTGAELTEQTELRAAIGAMPYQDAEILSMRAMILAGADETIDAIYACPRCKAVSQPDDEPLRITDLPVTIAPGPEVIEIEVTDPVEAIDGKTGQVIERIETLTFHHPTLDDCSRAMRKTGMQDTTRLQFQIYTEALEAVNGNPVTGQWKGTWGVWTFDRSEVADLRKIASAMDRWGMETKTARRCTACGKEWTAEVDASGFFASGLRSQ